MLRANEKLVLALPKGRILAEVMPVVPDPGVAGDVIEALPEDGSPGSDHLDDFPLQDV